MGDNADYVEEKPRRKSKGEKRLEKKIEATAQRARYFYGAIVCLMIAAGLLEVWNSIFPHRPHHVNESDSSALKELFTGGKPHFVLCSNGTTDKNIRRVFETTATRLANNDTTPVTAAVVDCTLPLGSGQSIQQRFRLNTHWRPMWFTLAGGRRPQQLTPYPASPTDLENKIYASASIGANRAMKISNLADMKTCSSDRSGGCVLLYTARSADAAMAELGALRAANIGVKFAVLNSTLLHLRPEKDSNAQTLLNAAIRKAKERIAEEYADENDGPKPKAEILVHLRRVPAHLASGEKGVHLLSALAPSAVSTVTTGDVVTLLQQAAAGFAQLIRSSGQTVRDFASGGLDDTLLGGDDWDTGSTGEAAEGVDIDALLNRDDELMAAQVALVSKTGLQVVKPAPKPTPTPTPKPKSAAERGRERADKRNARNDQRRKQDEDEAKEAAAATAAPSLSPAEILERDRLRRQRMLEEEAASGHVAHAAEDEEQEEQDVEEEEEDEEEEEEREEEAELVDEEDL